MTPVGTDDGVTVAVHDLGGRGRPAVLAHGAGFHGLALAPLARHLAPVAWCVALDFRGHGDSGPPPPGGLDWDGLAQDVLAVVAGLALDRPWGVGHSSGATALLLAEQARPGTFGALYCFEPVVVPADPPLGRDPDNWLARAARRRRTDFASRAEAGDWYASRSPFDALDPEVLAAYVDHGLRDRAGGGVELKCRPEVEAAVYETATAHSAYPRLGEIGCPVTLACGSTTTACPPGQAGALAGVLPRGRFEVLDGIGHLGPLERPSLVAGSVHRALAGGPGPG